MHQFLDIGRSSNNKQTFESEFVFRDDKRTERKRKFCLLLLQQISRENKVSRFSTPAFIGILKARSFDQLEKKRKKDWVAVRVQLPI